MKKLPLNKLRVGKETLRALEMEREEWMAVNGGWTASCTAKSQCGTCPEA
jgi:hypothetical protein